MKATYLRKGAMVLLAVALVVSGGYFVKQTREVQQEVALAQEVQDAFVTIEIQEEAIPLASVPTEIAPVDAPTSQASEDAEGSAVEEEVTTPSLTPDIAIDFEGLFSINRDAVGWLYIPNTAISYPLLQGDTNQTYLRTAYDKSYSLAGSLFLDYRISGDFTSQNTIVYGHNMQSEIMFGTLSYYETLAYAQSHPYIFVLTEAGYLRYEVCYAFITSSDSAVYDYQFEEEGDFASHLSMLADLSYYDTGVAVTDQDCILTLSTCTGVISTERFVVVAKLAVD